MIYDLSHYKNFDFPSKSRLGIQYHSAYTLINFQNFNFTDSNTKKKKELYYTSIKISSLCKRRCLRSSTYPSRAGKAFCSFLRTFISLYLPNLSPKTHKHTHIHKRLRKNMHFTSSVACTVSCAQNSPLQYV